MTQLLRFHGTALRDRSVDVWMRKHAGELGDIALQWFNVMRSCGADVREVLHDGHPTACVEDAGFAYVNAFTGHVNVGFFKGTELEDRGGLLEGNGKFMRHVKIRPGQLPDPITLTTLIHGAYEDMKRRVMKEQLAAR